MTQQSHSTSAPIGAHGGVKTNARNAKLFMRAVESEIQLLRYWMLQTLHNYRAWQREVAATSAHHAATRDSVTRLIAKALGEYRRKQQIHRDLCLEYPYLSMDDIVSYQSINHYGSLIADADRAANAG